MQSQLTKRAAARPPAESCLDGLRRWLTPALWKQAEQARASRRQAPRWSTQPLILTLLAMTWCCGDSQAERFETAKGFTIACLPKRRRPGGSVQGFQLALASLPICVLRVLAAGVRRRLLALLDLGTDGWIVFGCDGSSLETPRAAELERRLDPPVRAQGRPQVWVTALVHLRTGVLWAWHLGKGYNRERSHLRALLHTLPATALLVADAGFNGYELAQALHQAGVSFLIRMSGKDKLYTEKQVALAKFREGEVFLWTQDAQRQGLPPLRARLLRLQGDRQRRDVWLVTNVLDAQRLPAARASQYYRWRWENEGLFRTFKRTLAKVRLLSRTVRELHREAAGALLATQLLLAQGAWACRRDAQQRRCSPRQVLLALRAVLVGKIGVRDPQAFSQRLAKAVREQRPRTSAKVSRRWPRRFNHRVSKPPAFLTLSPAQKALLHKLLDNTT